jgi:hypothetical protein
LAQALSPLINPKHAKRPSLGYSAKVSERKRKLE